MTRRIAAALLLCVCTVAGAAGQDELQQHFAVLRAQLDPRVQAALDRIDGLGRQLLATRGYLRAGAALEQRWGWTQEQIAAYPGSPDQIRLDAQIGKVRAAFEQANPGYTLFVNPQVRSLDLQLQRWNQNQSVTRAGEFMATAMHAAVRAPGFPTPGSAAALARFQQRVRDHRPRPQPTLAAPGLSAHGRMGAVDFQVRQGSRTVAGPDSSTVTSVWIAQGWRDRLQVAVHAADAHFNGPLSNPAEPWHYDYRP